MITSLKQCSKCKQVKELDYFHNVGKKSTKKRASCKVCNASENKQFRIDNREQVLATRSIWLEKNSEHMRQYYKDYATANREHKNQYYVERRKVDINFRMAYLLRGRLYSALKGQAKAGSAVDNLGCTIEFFIKYIESKWQSGMNWDNYGKGLGKWSFDHILPMIHFNLSDPEQVKIVCHYTNMQPLWFRDNVIKGDKLDYNLSKSARQPSQG